MKPAAPPGRQRGVALWMLLILLATAGGYLFYRGNNLEFSAARQRTEVANTLARAKEALIAYAVTDAERPGSLPCPDLVTNSAGLSNVPGDGKTDFFTTNICPSYVGWLPWVTLKLPELTDDTGTRLWYVLAPNLRNHSSTQPINSDTSSGLTVDGNTDIAALIIAAHSPLTGQTRPSNTPSDYLDGENGNGNDNIYVTGPRSDSFNDEVLIVTRQELMAAVEKRIANEVRSCLDQHALSSANPQQRYPWPAPFSAISYQGKENSLFGRVPSTQPTSGPEAALLAVLARLTQTLTLLSTATDGNAQLAALNTLADTLLQARNLFDAIFSSANQLKQYADNVQGEMQSLDTAIDLATANGRIAVSEGTTIRSLSGSTTDTDQSTLLRALDELGLDAFPWQLQQWQASLAATTSAAGLQTLDNAIADHLAATTTARADILPALSTAQSAANTAAASARLAVQMPWNAVQLTAARNDANTLRSALASLQQAVESSRVSILSGEARDLRDSLSSLNSALSNAPNETNLTSLRTALANAKTTVEGITTGVSAVVTARNAATAALASALTAAQASSPDYATVATAMSAVLTNLDGLRAAIVGNEAVDNNLTHTSLAAAITAYDSARDAFVSVDTRRPRPNQRTITPYATTLDTAAVHIAIWAKTISDNAALIAPLAKANPVASGTSASSAAVLDTSGYAAASSALSGLQASSGTLAALQAYLAAPSAERQAQAIAALAATVNQINQVISRGNALDALLSSSKASASPIIWLASRCDFLLANTASWWSNNAWSNTLFYQISHPLRSVPGQLTVNATRNLHVVAIAAGRALSGQSHGTQSVANFLEGSNADASRNGDATSPSLSFTATPPSATFNDRLAY